MLRGGEKISEQELPKAKTGRPRQAGDCKDDDEPMLSELSDTGAAPERAGERMDSGRPSCRRSDAAVATSS